MTQAWNSDQNMIFKTWVFQKLTFSSKWVSTKSEFHFFLSFLSFSLHFSFFAFTHPLTSSVSILTQWFPDCSGYDGDHILPWPSGVLYLTSHIQGDSVLTKHKDDMKHETFIDEPLILITWLSACAQGSPGFQGERRGDLPSPTEYKGLTIKKLTANQPFNTQIKFVILLTVNHTVLIMLVQRI